MPRPNHGILARIFSISALVKARSVCVRILPSKSADNSTLAAVSSFGASKTHIWSYWTECPVHLLDGNSLRLHLRGPVSYSLSGLLGSVNALISELHQADVCRHGVSHSLIAIAPAGKCDMMPARFGSGKTVAREFNAACAWELE